MALSGRKKIILMLLRRKIKRKKKLGKRFWVRNVFMKECYHLQLESLGSCQSGHRRCSIKKKFKIRKIHWKTSVPESLFFNKVARLRPANLLKKGLWHMRFPENFTKF